MARRFDMEDYVPRQQFAPGEPAPGQGLPGVPAPTPQQAPPQQVAPFSYRSPLWGAQPQGGFNVQQYQGPMRYDVPQAPEFYAPAYEGLNAEQLFSDPSYQFRLGQGLEALQRSAAARGMLRSGNTLQGLVDYGQQAASQEYAAAEERARGQYGLNYQATRDMYAPRLQQWQAQIEAERAAFDRPWEAYQFGQGARLSGYDAQLRAQMAALDDEFRRQQMLYTGGLGSWG